MKFKFFLLLMITMILAPFVSMANPGDIVDAVKEAQSWEDLLSLETAIYTAVITLGGYISAFIPGINAIENGTWRVLVFAIIVITASVMFGIGNVWLGAISYFFSTSLYETVLKWFVRSPKPSEVN